MDNLPHLAKYFLPTGATDLPKRHTDNYDKILFAKKHAVLIGFKTIFRHSTFLYRGQQALKPLVSFERYADGLRCDTV